jgi:NAD(P)-dependent dehydrogenase (short-subunit alcohol dehydrogenase family)
MHLVVTGSSTGIGRALAERFLSRGHLVWGLARSDQAEFVARHPGTFRATRCDIAEWAQVERAAANIAAGWPHVDGLVTCAAVQGEIGRAVTADPARWTATVRANLDGTFHAIRAFDALLALAPRRAKIVCFSGGGATKPRPRFSAYGVAKTAVVRLVETIAEEERGRALDINAIAPGAINTRLTDEVLTLGPNVVGEAEYRAALKTKGGSPAILPATSSTAAASTATADATLEKALGLVEWLLSPASDRISGRLLAAPWDPWATLEQHANELAPTDIYTLRRVVPEDRGMRW